MYGRHNSELTVWLPLHNELRMTATKVLELRQRQLLVEAKLDAAVLRKFDVKGHMKITFVVEGKLVRSS